MAGFEPTTSCTPSKRASQAALHPVSFQDADQNLPSRRTLGWVGSEILILRFIAAAMRSPTSGARVYQIRGRSPTPAQKTRPVTEILHEPSRRQVPTVMVNVTPADTEISRPVQSVSRQHRSVHFSGWASYGEPDVEMQARSVSSTRVLS